MFCRQIWRSLTLLALLAIASVRPAPVWAFEFQPDPLEFESWPIYCQGRYVETNAGQKSPFANRIPISIRAPWRRMLGDETWFGVHHYCAGLIYLNRARAHVPGDRRNFLLSTALAEAMFTYRNMPQRSPLFTQVAVALSTIETERGNHAEAVQYLDLARSKNPQDPAVHINIALAYRDMKDLSKAREVLEAGLGATSDESLELRYNLGLICLELNDLRCAEEQAKICYSAGYPLPGLKNHLAAAGRWPASP